MRWKAEYAIGVPEIDAQHKQLFDLADEATVLLEMPDCIDKYDDIISIVEALKDYVVYHFSEEEKLLQKIAYQKFSSHQLMHQTFIEKMNTINLYEVDSNQTDELRHITTLIIEWLIAHVLGEDRRWAFYYIAQQKANEI